MKQFGCSETHIKICVERSHACTTGVDWSWYEVVLDLVTENISLAEETHI